MSRYLSLNNPSLTIALTIALKLYTPNTKRDMKILLIFFTAYCLFEAVMANILDTEAIMTALIRTRSGVFSLGNSVKLEDLTSENIQNYLIDLNYALSGNKEIEIDANSKDRLLNGVPLDVELDDGQVVVKFEKQVLGIGEVISNKLKIKNYLWE